MKQKILCLLLFISLPAFFLPGQQYSEFTSETVTQDYAAASTPQTLGNLSEDLNQSTLSLSGQKANLLSQENPWNSLRSLINEGLEGLSESSTALKQLEEELAVLQAETSEQRLLYEESQNLLNFLKRNLEEALAAIDLSMEQTIHAEDYAFLLDAQNSLLKEQVKRQNKSALTGFTFGALSFGLGTPLITEGVRRDNKGMLLTGGTIMFGTGLAWLTGHYLLKLW